MINNFIKQLEIYMSFNEQEQKDRELILRYMHAFHDVYERSNLFGHMTCSPWIVNQDFTKVLMVYHNIYDSWGWCGGHCDGERNMTHVALKEGREETGLDKIELVSDEILSLEVLPVPSHIKHHRFVSAHVHLNITYLCMADDTFPLRIKPDENSGVRWILIEEIDKFVSEEAMKPIYHKLVEKSKAMVHK